MIKIAIDAMGGDYGIETTIPGSILALKEFKDIEIILYGDKTKIEPLIKGIDRISVKDYPKTVDMGCHDPVSYIRKNLDCSLAASMQACKNKEADAIVTCGPTQVVIVASHMIIKKLKQMSRVALCPIIPSYDGKGRVLLDVGANVELRSEHLYDLAICASIVSREVLGNKNPRVGLLNIGTEEGKGRPLDKETYELFKNQNKFNFYGNVETKEVLTTDCEVLLTDGFTGNMVLKTIEGTGKTVGKMLKDEIKSSLGGKIGYLFMRKNLKRFAKRLDASEVGGAMVLGLPNPVIKSHGSSDAYTFKNAIRQARTMVLNDVVGKIISNLEKESLE